MGMSSKLHPALQAKQTDNGIRVNPSHVEINPDLKARWLGTDQEHIDELAERLAREDQEVPCSTRKIKTDEGDKLELVAGEHRLAAARKINEDEELRAIAEEAGNIHPKTGIFMLKVMISTMTDKEAMLLAIDENNLRKATNAIDDAHNQLILKEQHGMSDKEIASRYGCGAAWISRMRLLTKLDDDTKKLVAKGDIPVQKGMDMASINEDQRADAIDEATDEDGNIDKTKLTEGIRSAANASKDKDGKGKQIGRNMTELRKHLKPYLENEDGDTPAETAFAKDLMRYIKGDVGIQGGLFNAAIRYAEAKADEEETSDEYEEVEA